MVGSKSLDKVKIFLVSMISFVSCFSAFSAENDDSFVVSMDKGFERGSQVFSEGRYLFKFKKRLLKCYLELSLFPPKNNNMQYISPVACYEAEYATDKPIINVMWGHDYIVVVNTVPVTNEKTKVYSVVFKIAEGEPK